MTKNDARGRDRVKIYREIVPVIELPNPNPTTYC